MNQENTGKPYSTITNQTPSVVSKKNWNTKESKNDTCIVHTAVGELGQSDAEQ